MAEIIVARWVNEEGRQTRKWYWEVRLGGTVRAAGIVKSKDVAWQRGVEELALCAYQRGMTDALDPGGDAEAEDATHRWLSTHAPRKAAS